MLKCIVLCMLAAVVGCTDFTKIWQDFPLKILSSNISMQCKEAVTNLSISIKNRDLNALKMIDATAKIPSGILSGNINQYGDYDECLKGADAQYCLAEIDLEPIWRQNSLEKYKELVHSYYFFRDDFGDPAHRLPGFSLIRWGFCIPKQCSREDLQTCLEDSFGVRTQIREGMCQTLEYNNNKIKNYFGALLARIILAGICLAVVLATIFDYWKIKVLSNSSKGGQILDCFNLRKNWESLMRIDETGTGIVGLHGIRAINVLALLMSHKSVSMLFNPFINRTYTIERLSKPWTIIAKNAIIYTDCFLLISGLLTATSLLTDLSKRNGMKLKEKLINRLFRILPNMVAIILFCTYILPSMGDGPMWPTVVDHHSQLCQQNMWTNFMFIHNYFGFRNMCLTHTHQIGIDMQLFLVTPVFVYLLWSSKKLGVIILTLVAGISTLLRLWATYKHELSSVIYFGISVTKMFATADFSYILPTHRATVYLIGVYLAFVLKYSNPNPELTKVFKYWAFFIVPFMGAWLGPYHMVSRTYVYNRIEATLISGLYPLFWGFSIALAIFLLNKHKKYIWLIGDFMCWKYFQIVTKLAYAVYLVQFPVFFYNVGINKSVDEYQTHYQLQVLETVAIILISMALVLCVEMPFMQMKNVIWPKKVCGNKTVSKNSKSG